MSDLDFIYKRHSVRKFKDQAVPREDIKEMIKAAIHAPSGKNKQNWHFVVVETKEIINGIAEVIKNKNAEIANSIPNEEMKTSFTKFVKYATHFTNAPVLILVYAGPYPPTGLKELQESGASSQEIHDLLKSAPGIQNIGAALENLLLAAANLGYGTCWMTAPNYASKEISKYINFDKEDYFLAAITPLGIPDGEVKSPPRKPVEEVMTIL